MFGSKKRPTVFRHVPNDSELMSLPMIHPGEFELNDKEIKQLRSRVYALNKDNALFRFRTMKEAPLLFVWRLEK